MAKKNTTFQIEEETEMSVSLRQMSLCGWQNKKPHQSKKKCMKESE